ncbi:hypothetical protein VP01_4544g1 [Puccinia sorghi]|uniref:Uncharacterized protein n=1 Tax=Puccinia sorghi TaxID=27349 RepID=A0A0L6UNT1_9BASI|nr:hypothetical protein VP01_4544g1 [Puccinia sorghi]
MKMVWRQIPKWKSIWELAQYLSTSTRFTLNSIPSTCEVRILSSFRCIICTFLLFSKLFPHFFFFFFFLLSWRACQSFMGSCHMLNIRLSFKSKAVSSRAHTFQPNIYLDTQLNKSFTNNSAGQFLDYLSKYNNKTFTSSLLIQTSNNPSSSMVRPQDFQVYQPSTCFLFQSTIPLLRPSPLQPLLCFNPLLPLLYFLHSLLLFPQLINIVIFSSYPFPIAIEILSYLLLKLICVVVVYVVCVVFVDVVCVVFVYVICRHVGLCKECDIFLHGGCTSQHNSQKIQSALHGGPGLLWLLSTNKSQELMGGCSKLQVFIWGFLSPPNGSPGSWVGLNFWAPNTAGQKKLWKFSQWRQKPMARTTSQMPAEPPWPGGLTPGKKCFCSTGGSLVILKLDS